MGKVRVTAGGTVLGKAVTSSSVFDSLRVPVSAPQSTKASSDERDWETGADNEHSISYRSLNDHQSTVCIFIHRENSLKVPGAFVWFTD